MRVAIPLGSTFSMSPERGGGYTFENELIQALFHLDSELTHTFRVFSFGQDIVEKEQRFRNIEIVYPHLTLMEKMPSTIKRYSSALLKKLVNPDIQYQVENWAAKFTRDSIRRDGTDLVWSFTPSCLTPTISYAVTIWDLQHRLQPYFPEVSSRREWATREHNFSSILRRATYVITGTQRGKAEIEGFYQIAPERIKILPFPTPQLPTKNIAEESSDVFSKYDIPKDYLFYPAQFWPHKNHIGLLLAIRLLRDKFNIYLSAVFVGSDKGNENYVRNIVRQLGLEQQVYFLGFVPRNDLYALYHSAFALTFVSFFGPDNLPPLEAFALGCPVIAADVPGAQEQLGNGAVFVNPGNEQEIALSIKALYENSDMRKTLIERGKERASSWMGEDYIRQMMKILDEFESIRRCWGGRETSL